jgi:hypothetical protein
MLAQEYFNYIPRQRRPAKGYIAARKPPKSNSGDVTDGLPSAQFVQIQFLLQGMQN